MLPFPKPESPLEMGAIFEFYITFRECNSTYIIYNLSDDINQSLWKHAYVDGENPGKPAFAVDFFHLSRITPWLFSMGTIWSSNGKAADSFVSSQSF